jgi:hypothetical protein
MNISNQSINLFVDSSKRAFYTKSSTDFRINMTLPIKCSKIILESFNIPLTWYNINSSNNTISIIYAGDTYIYNPVGRYTEIESLLADIKNYFDTETEDEFIFSQGDNGKLTITAGTNFQIVFVSGELWDILGCSSSQTLTGQTSYTFSNCPKFYSLDKYIMIKIDYLDGQIEHINNIQDSSTFIVQLPNLYSKIFGEMIEWININNSNSLILNSPISLQSFNIGVYNQDNELIDLNNNDFTMSLRIFS